mgnify:CR=1 FL=1
MKVFFQNYESWMQKTLKEIKILLFFFVSILFLINPCYAQSGNLRFGISGFPPSLGNPYSAMGLPAWHLWGNLYDGLTEIADNGEVIPALATKWEQTQPNIWVFTLRDNIKFHNDLPFDATSVIETILFLKSKSAKRYLIANEVKNIKSVQALSNYKIQISTYKPDSILPRRLSIVMIIDHNLLNDIGPEGYGKNPIGTGSFKFLKWGVGNSSVTLKPFKKNKLNKTNINSLILHRIPNALGREQALIAGDMDIVENINSDAFHKIKSEGFNMKVNQRSVILSIALPNMISKKSPLNLLKVRQALNYAVDKKSIAKHIFNGVVKPATQGSIKGTIGYHSDIKGYPYDPVKARILLKEAGYPEGFKLNIAILQLKGSSQEHAFQKVQQDLSAIGIETYIKPLSGSEFIFRFSNSDWEDYDAFSLLWNNEPMRDIGRSIEYFSCLRPNAFFCDKSINDLIVKSRIEENAEKRLVLLKNITSQLKESAPSIWLTNQTNITAWNKKIKNIHMGPTGIKFDNIRIEQ